MSPIDGGFFFGDGTSDQEGLPRVALVRASIRIEPLPVPSVIAASPGPETLIEPGIDCRTSKDSNPS